MYVTFSINQEVPEWLYTHSMPISQVSVELDRAASGVEEPAPTLLVIGQLGQIKEVFLVAEGTLICQVKAREAPLALLAVFYVYMSYPKGLETFYVFRNSPV